MRSNILILTTVSLFLIAATLWAKPADRFYLNITKFLGLSQAMPSHQAVEGLCFRGKSFSVDSEGALQRSLSSTVLSTPPPFGVISNPTSISVVDPGGNDTSRKLIITADVASPTNGSAGQHVFSADVTSSNSADDLSVDYSSWHQVDDEDELSFSDQLGSGVFSKAYTKGMVFLSVKGGGRILGVCGEQQSATAISPTTCYWAGTNARPTVASIGAGTLSGTYKYKTTIISPLGQSYPSKPSQSITTSSGSNRVTINETLPPSATSFGIWRTGAAISLDNADFESWTAGNPDDWDVYSGSFPSSYVTSSEDNSTVVLNYNTSGTAGTPEATGYGLVGTQSTTIKTEGTASYGFTIPTYPTYSLPTAVLRYIYGSGARYSIENYDWLSLDIYHPTEMAWHSTSTNENQSPSALVKCYDANTGGSMIVGNFVVSGYGILSDGWNTLYPRMDSAFWYTSNHDVKWIDQMDAGIGTAYLSNNPTTPALFDNLLATHDGHYSGNKAMKLQDNAGSGYMLYQYFDGTNFRGEQLTFNLRVKCRTLNTLSITIYDDGDTLSEVATHTTTDQTFDSVNVPETLFHLLTVTKTMSATASSTCRVNILLGSASNVTAIVDSASISVGAPSNTYYWIGSTTGPYFDDSVADSLLSTSESVGSSAITSIGNRSYMPAGEWIAYHKQRLWSIGDTVAITHANYLWYSDDGDFDTWPTTNYIPVGYNDGDPPTGLCSYRGLLYIFKRNSIWRLRGVSSSDFELEKIVSGTGCDDGRTIAASSTGIYFYGTGSVWRFDGFNLTNMSEPIRYGYLDDIYIDSTDGDFQTSSMWDGFTFTLAYKTAAVEYADYFLNYDTRSKLWSRQRHNSGPSVFEFANMRKRTLLSLCYDGNVLAVANKGHADASLQELEWFTPAYNFGDFLVEHKRIDRISLVVDSGFSSNGTAYTLSLYDDPTDRELFSGDSMTAMASTTYAITTGINILEWNTNSDRNITGGSKFRTMSIGISESAVAATTAEQTTLSPPKVLGLSIYGRLKDREP